MQDERKPGDLSIRFSFARVYGSGPDRGQIKPAIDITDQMSGKTIHVELTPEDLAELFAGGAAEIPADRVNGFAGARDWGKTHIHVTRLVTTQPGDYKLRNDRDAVNLPHVASVISEMQKGGYRCDRPRRNNGGQWVLIGRKYEDLP